MQVEESTVKYQRTLSINADIYDRILTFKGDNQTFEDVLQQSLDALEEKKIRDTLPCIDDAYIEEHQAEWDAAEEDFENSYVSLEEVIKNYPGKKN